ncbi:pleiotropic drug resistance ABC transporter [Favolaschia claudopus]|uniref:Pleiotropic drug resistance ABC transporter n=1 Tax=Favolaschia claudopus TaxID=2862362 RepID=A0AAW0C6W4_9AGAR
MDHHGNVEDRTSFAASMSSTTSSRHRRRPSSEPVLMTYQPTFAIPLDSPKADKQDQFSEPRKSREEARRSREARRSSVRVSVDYFDPAGVQELHRNISNASKRNSRRSSKRYSNLQPVSGDSNVTLIHEAEPFDFEKTLKFIQGKMEEAHVESRELGVAFQDLGVVGLGASVSYLPTVGSTFNPMAIAESISSMRHPPLRNILEGFSGVVRPGEMLLVLGRPGSGCSTLLKTLANQTDEYHSVKGKVHFDALTPLDIAHHYRGDVQYCPEDDLHFPTLTVEQTLQFATRLRAPQAKARMIGQSRTEYIDSMVEMLLTIFGLRGVRSTPVGDQVIRGISGGQKKRVSIGEALATRMRLGSWDNSTRGLDSSTALEFGRALRIATDASESLYALFDKVCVISEGRMVYFGRADQARDYFLSLGYVPQAERQTTADFLVSVCAMALYVFPKFTLAKVTDPVGRIVRPGLTPAEDRARPRTSADLAKHYLNSSLMRDNLEEITEYNEECAENKERAMKYQRSAEAEHANHTRLTSAFMTSIAMQARALTIRRAQIIMGALATTMVNVNAFVIQGVIYGTVFLKSPESTSAFFGRGGLMFLSLLLPAITGLAEIAALFATRPIILRQYKAALYHPFVESMALTIVDIPISFICTVAYTVTAYFLAGLQRTAEQFFIFFLFLFLLSVAMKGFFRACAAAFKTIANAQAVAGLISLIFIVYTGYTLPKRPVRYAFEALMANEFRTLRGSCDALVPQGPGYENITLDNQVCATSGAVAGQSFVDGNRFIALAFGYFYSNQWLNVGIVVTFSTAFIIAFLVFTEFNTASASVKPPVVLFKRGSKKATAVVETKGKDVEMANVDDASVYSMRQAQTKEAFSAAEPMADIFSWQNINYVVPVKEEGVTTRKLLDNVAGYVAPGTLTALMGESGAGKTTLLNVLAERTTTGVVSGDRQAMFSKWIHMYDRHCREALLFSAKLRQPASVPWEEKVAYVEKCLKMCGLDAVADASVGSLGIENRKRTTIGVELAAKPKLLLFLDEVRLRPPSFVLPGAWAIMLFLKQLAASGQAILCTIHQPSAELFEMFDRLLLLKKGGKVVYFGDIGQNSSTLLRYFEAKGARGCSSAENPAEYMLDVIGAGATASSSQDWETVWRRAPESGRAQQELDRIHAHGRSRGAVQATFTSTYAASWFQQFAAIYKRDLMSRWRDPVYIIAKLFLNIAAGIFLGFTFFQTDNSQQGAESLLFALYMSTIMAAPLVNQLQIPFLDIRQIYEVREGPTKFYSWTALIASQLFTELPWNILASSLFFVTWYWLCGFDTDRAPFSYLMVGVIFPLWFTSLGQATAAMAPNAEVAGLAFGFMFSLVSTFSGVLQPAGQLPGGWKWINKVVPFTYYIEGNPPCANKFLTALGRKELVCSAVELVTVNPPSGQTCGEYFAAYRSFAGGYLTNENATTACQFCSTATTDQLFRIFSIFYDHHWRDAALMFAYIGFNVACIFSSHGYDSASSLAAQS